jgi:hypothetical protein
MRHFATNGTHAQFSYLCAKLALVFDATVATIAHVNDAVID